METKYIEPLKWWDNLQPNTKDVLIKKYKDSGIPEFDNTSEVFNKMTDWDRVVIIYEKETKPFSCLSFLLEKLQELKQQNQGITLEAVVSMINKTVYFDGYKSLLDYEREQLELAKCIQSKSQQTEQLQGKEVQTAEEILDKYCNPDGKGVAIPELQAPLLAAMREYASQFESPVCEGIHKVMFYNCDDAKTWEFIYSAVKKVGDEILSRYCADKKQTQEGQELYSREDMEGFIEWAFGNCMYENIHGERKWYCVKEEKYCTSGKELLDLFEPPSEHLYSRTETN